MINKKDNPVEWALIGYDLDELQEHLHDLLERFTSEEGICEEEFKVEIAHLYAHLNRIYHRRNHIGEISDKDFDEYTKFPTDIKPLG